MNFLDLTGGTLEVLSSDPSDVWSGRVYLNSSTGMVRVYEGGSWKNITVGSVMLDLSTTPTDGQFLMYNATDQVWEPQSFNPFAVGSTDDVGEGSTNLYYTDARVAAAPAVTALDTRLDTAEADIGNLEADVATLDADLNTAEADIAALEAADIALDSRLDTAEAEIDALQAADISLDSRLDTAEGTLVSLDTRLDTAESDIDALQAADVSLDARLDTAEADIDALEASVAGKQASDSDLTAIAGLATTGLIARTGSGTAATRTITGTSGKIDVTDGNGVSGNPTLNIGSDVVTKTDTQVLENKTYDYPNMTGVALIDDIPLDPISPSTGFIKVYAKDKKLKVKNEDGVVVEVGSSSAGTGEINVITNPSAATAIDGWVASGAGVTVARTTTNSDLPLAGVIDSAIKITPVSGTDYVCYRWTMPAALKGRKLKVEWHQRPLSGYATGDFKVEVYKNSALDYTGSYTEFALSTDSSGTSSIPNATGKYTTYFQADTSDYYELRIVRTAGTTALNIASVIVGPGIQHQGAVVGESGQSIAITSNVTTNTTLTGRYQRVGNVMELEADFAFSGTNTQNVSAYIQLPSGFTIDTSKLTSTTDELVRLGIASAKNADGGEYNGMLTYNSSTRINIHLQLESDPPKTNNWNPSTNQPMALASGDFISCKARIPIAEWAGSGTLNIAQNDVEYAYNSTTWADSSNNTNFGYGPTGVAFLNTDLSTVRGRTVRFQTSIQPTDRIEIEVKTNGTWVPALGALLPASGYAFVPFNYATGTSATNTMGIGWKPVSGSSTDIEVVFGRYFATYSGDSGTVGWAAAISTDSGNIYWRVKKTSGGAAVGFGLATSTQSGLVTLPGSMVESDTGNGHGSSSTAVRRFTNNTTTGTAITCSGSDASLGTTYTINEAGIYSINYTDYKSSGSTQIGISVNSNQLTTSILTITSSHRKALIESAGANFYTQVNATIRCSAGDVVRPHTDGTPNGTTLAAFRITQICKL